MAGEDQYINPIIQAMIHTSQIQAGAKELAERTRQAKAEEAFRQSQLAQQETQFEKSHELNLQHLDIAKRQLEAQLEGEKINRVGALHGLQIGGVDIGSIFGQQGQGGEGARGSYAPQPQIPTVINPSPNNVNIPGIGNVNPSAFGSPAQQAQITYEESRAKARGTEEGAAPAAEAKAAADFKRTVRLHEIDSDRNIEVERQRAANNIEVAKIHAAATRAALLAGINDPQAAAQAYAGILDGQTSYSALPKELKIAVDHIAGQRGTNLPTNQKQYSDRLDTVTGIEDLVRQYKDLATNYSRDSKDSSILYKLPLVNGTKIPYTDLKSKADALKATGGSLASFFDKQNRKSDAEILRQFDGLFDPKSTMQQNLDKINSHVQIVNDHLKGLFSGISKDDLGLVLSNRGLTELAPSATPQGGGSSIDELVKKHGGR